MLQAGIETWLTLCQPDILPQSHQQTQRKGRDFNIYVSLFCFVLICTFYGYRVLNLLEELCITPVATGNYFAKVLNSQSGEHTGWNDKIVVLKKTTLQLYFKTFIEKNQFMQLDYVVEQTSIQCSLLQPQSPPRYGSGTESMLFPQAPAGAR